MCSQGGGAGFDKAPTLTETGPEVTFGHAEYLLLPLCGPELERDKEARAGVDNVEELPIRKVILLGTPTRPHSARYQMGPWMGATRPA